MIPVSSFPRPGRSLEDRAIDYYHVPAPQREDRDTPDREIPDEELIAGIARRDESALSALYERHSTLLFALALRVLEDRGEAEDVLQGVFVKIWGEASRYDPAKGSVRGWLISCARHAAIDQSRRRGVQRKVARLAALEAPRAAAAEALPGGDDHRKRIAEAFEILPADQREAIELAYFKGMSQSEIAERLGQPLGTVKTRIRLGMARLREALAGFVKEQK